MRLLVEPDPAAAAAHGALLLACALGRRDVRNLQPATGNSPRTLYALLPGALGSVREDVARRLNVYQMDEYAGLARGDERSLYGWMLHDLTDPLGIPRSRVVPLLEAGVAPEISCRCFDEKLAAAGGLDVLVAGLGPNGHLGFNEPPSSPDSPSRIVDLTPESVQSNAAYWGCTDRVPRRAATTGLRAMLAARAIMVVVTGAHKRSILQSVLLGPVTSAVPASFLQQAPQTVILADRAACDAELERQFLSRQPVPPRFDDLPLFFRP